MGRAKDYIYVIRGEKGIQAMPRSSKAAMPIDPATMYSSVRQEILDQKKCQFQLFCACISVSAAALAYAGAARASPAVYIAPMLLNVLGLTIILDKATRAYLVKTTVFDSVGLMRPNHMTYSD